MVCGKEFKESLRKPMPNASRKKCRIVPAFTIQALQKNTCVQPPPKTCALCPITIKNTLFRYRYKRGDFPFAMKAKGLVWKTDVTKLDYQFYLPLLFDGLAEKQQPYKRFAMQAIHDMLKSCPKKVFPVLPQLILPLKKALNTRNKDTIRITLKVIQHLIRIDARVGIALVPYYRQLLPILNMFKDENVNCGDAIDTSQKKGQNVADAISETLELMERCGGEDAFINIKYMIPTYESCVLN